MAKQAAYYTKQLEDKPALRRYYGLESPEASPSEAAYFIALLTDLPPRWIEDVSPGAAEQPALGVNDGAAASTPRTRGSDA